MIRLYVTKSFEWVRTMLYYEGPWFCQADTVAPIGCPSFGPSGQDSNVRAGWPTLMVPSRCIRNSRYKGVWFEAVMKAQVLVAKVCIWCAKICIWRATILWNLRDEPPIWKECLCCLFFFLSFLSSFSFFFSFLFNTILLKVLNLAANLVNTQRKERQGKKSRKGRK